MTVVAAKRFLISGKTDSRKVWINGEQLLLEGSLKVANHSPDGFGWGYSGSGSSQLSLAICLHLCGTAIAVGFYREFRDQVLTRLPMSKNFELMLVVDSNMILWDILVPVDKSGVFFVKDTK